MRISTDGWAKSAATIAVLAALLGLPLSAQQPGLQAAKTQTDTAVIRGMISDAHGHPLASIVIRLRLAGSDQFDRTASTKSNGRYEFRDLAPGTYHLRIECDGIRTLDEAVYISRGEDAVLCFVASSSKTDLVVTIIAILLYCAFVLVFRRYNITWPTQQMLLAELDDMRVRINLEADRDADKNAKTAGGADTLINELVEIRKQLVAPKGVVQAIASFLLWSRGRELAAWSRVHEIDRQLVSFLIPPARVFERVQVAEAQLRAKNAPQALALANRIHTTVTAATSPPASDAAAAATADQLKQQLSEALSIINDDDDVRFAGLMEWHNKAMFLAVSALLAILMLSVAFQHEQLFLLGAVGGLMSRMARSLFREDVPTDYGASWTTLFLSPLLGAIAAWVGIVFIQWMAYSHILGQVFMEVQWDPPWTILTLALAFVLGFSERLFTSLLGTVEGRVSTDAQKAGGSTAAAPSRPSGVPAPILTTAKTQGSPLWKEVTIRLAIQRDFDSNSLKLTVDDAPITVPQSGMIELTLPTGGEHRIAATATRKGTAVKGVLAITPTLDDEGNSFGIILQ